MGIKKWFRKYEYQIGIGTYDTSGMFGPIHFDSKEYYFQLITSYVFDLMAIMFSWGTVVVCQQGAPWWCVVEFVVLTVVISVAAVTEPLQKARNLHWRLSKVSLIIKENAKISYGNDWREPAIECYEAHVTGDCPLCGAI